MDIHNTFSEQDFHHDRFWTKIARYALKAGRKLIEKALILYFVATDGDTPRWAKASIFAALAYFVSPLDAIPDVLPAVGYSDDLSVLGAALVAVSAHVKEEHVQKARQQLERWFG